MEGLMATPHLKKCVQALTNAMHDLKDGPSCREKSEGLAAAFELIDQPWDPTDDKIVLIWRDGYGQCMQDIVDAIADEWGVTLPADPLRGKENKDEGARQ